jgi:hypothetical protein
MNRLDPPEMTAWDYVQSALEDLRLADSRLDDAIGNIDELKHNTFLMKYAEGISADIGVLKQLLKELLND